MSVSRVLGAALAAGCVSAATVVGLAGAAHADPSTLTVGNPARCAGAQYTTISAAVAAASPGDTIKVCAGIYGEHVDISTPNLTLQGVRAGVSAVNRAGTSSTISNANGAVTIEASANGTTIDGFTIQGGSVNNADGMADFTGSSGLTLVNNIIKLNANGMNLQNPDASMPALIKNNEFLNNNAGGNPGDNGRHRYRRVHLQRPGEQHHHRREQVHPGQSDRGQLRRRRQQPLGRPAGRRTTRASTTRRSSWLPTAPAR